MTTPAVRADDDATLALCALMEQIDACTAQLAQAHERAEQLLLSRRAGTSWEAIVTAEERPLIVEQISSVLAALNSAGADWRREQAAALQAEHVSINRIAAMFGVTRQRISALLRESGADQAG